MANRKAAGIVYALAAAGFYAVNMPFSKLMLSAVSSTIMAGLLYLGAGIGVGIMFVCSIKKSNSAEFLTRSDLPYTIGMVVLDIAAPIFLMHGLANTTSANASLLNNFEIVATAVIAFAIFKESISKRLWCAIVCVTAASIMLSFEDISSLKLSWGSIFVLLAALCWGFENNCTRKISTKNAYEIVTIKGICSGIGSLIVAFFIGEKLPSAGYIAAAMLLGFVAYGLSIFCYIRAQKELGAAKTSAYDAIAPFIGAFLSFVFLRESLSGQYVIALIIMAAGTIISTADTLIVSHTHEHTHTIIHTHNGVTHEHTYTHTHAHYHFMNDDVHNHAH